MRARAPASAANLGPGLDVLGLALRLHCEVDAAPADALAITAIGEGADLPGGPEHLAARVAVAVSGHDRWALTVRSSIPVARGLGSSSALALATAAAVAGAVAGAGGSTGAGGQGGGHPLAVAAAFDGHAENAAAACLGGLVVATGGAGSRGAVPASGTAATRLALDPALVAVVVVPDRPLPTARARHALPDRVALADATFNLGRLALLVAGLADHRVLVAEATDDHLHDEARRPLFPEAAELRRGLVAAGALAAATSGAGPSVIGFCRRGDGPRLRDAGHQVLSHAGVAGQALLLEPDLEGLVVEEP
ncbi:MAG: homoserine kinase [Acidimicrobiales bacterium]